jgi:CRISPR-associated protein Cas2
MANRDLYLFCYDVACPRRWRRVHRLLAGYRVAGQKSVFECLMTVAEREACVSELRRLIDPACDRVHVLALDPRLPREGWGIAAPFGGGPLLVT